MILGSPLQLIHVQSNVVIGAEQYKCADPQVPSINPRPVKRGNAACGRNRSCARPALQLIHVQSNVVIRRRMGGDE